MMYKHLNPQHQYLIEKIEEQEREIKRLNADVLEAHEMCDECLNIAKHFNSMPWYKKIFYKFKI